MRSNRRLVAAVATLLFAAAAVFGFRGLLLISDPEALRQFGIYLFYKLEIYSYDATQAYYFLRGVILVLGFVGPLLMVPLFAALWATPKAYRLLSLAAETLRWLTFLLLLGLSGMVLFILGKYALFYIQRRLEILILTMLLSEGLFMVIWLVLLYCLSRFFHRTGESLDLLYLSLLTGKPEAAGSPTFPIAGLIAIGMITLLLGCFRLPDIHGCLAFSLCGAADLLLGAALFFSRRQMQKRRYASLCQAPGL